MKSTIVSALLLASPAVAQTHEGFLKDHCVRCHNQAQPKGGVRLDDLSGDVGKDLRRWLAVQEQVKSGLMPPKNQPRPPVAAQRQFEEWLARRVAEALPHAAERLPSKGNMIPHEALFGQAAGEVAPAPGRLWRLSAEAYFGLMREVYRGRADGLVQPFSMIPEKGFKDFAALYAIDEPSTEVLLRNAALIVDLQTAHEVKDGKLRGKNDAVREFVALMAPETEPTKEQLRAALRLQFRLALMRAPQDDEVERYLAFYEKCAQGGDGPGAVKTMLQAVLLRGEAVFRTELGGAPDAQGHRRLTPAELAMALSLALGKRRDMALFTAAEKGELSSREQIAAQVKRILDNADGRNDNSRILTFFQQYFEYTLAPEIFKEGRFPLQETANTWKKPTKDPTPRGSLHYPVDMVNDTDRLVLHIVAEDKDVLARLLTTELSFVNFRLKEDKATRQRVPAPALDRNGGNYVGFYGPEYVYGFTEWPAMQPTAAPADKPRLGILMQPSWLVAHSTNFDNDPVRRGRWIRERLLGQSVPDLPIGVAAQVPDEPHRTFRDRLTVTRDEKCWTCHKYMDNLGLPFEQFSHYGVYQSAELVQDKAATLANVDKKGNSLGAIFTTAKLDTSGEIALTGDAQLDGLVADPYELVRRLAASQRVRQVFVRHAFRFFMGRNESLSDAKTLQDADRAYVQAGGSFKALVTSLLTSDSFLLRAAPAEGKKP